MVTNLGKIVKLSLLGCGACLGMGYTFHRKFVSTMAGSLGFEEAMNTVKNHKGALYLLGEPIESKKPVLANKGILLAGFSEVQVRVKGPKSEGIVFIKVVNDENDKAIVDSIQLQVGRDYSKRLLIKDSSRETSLDTKE